MKTFELIRRRTSVRSYNHKELSKEVLTELGTYCSSLGKGPFQNKVRLQILDLGLLDPRELKSMGTYGIIKGARYYILGSIRQAEKSLEDLGYCMEKAIIKATAMGLGTCWLGGTFKRAAFAASLGLAEDEMLPAITPVGYPARESSIQDKLIRNGAKSHKRKTWEELFFSGGADNPLSKQDAGPFINALEAVRLGPSASNRQPWRLIRDEGGAFHFFLKENYLYNRILGKYKMQNIDMGIAMSHFELVCRDEQLPGSWNVSRPDLAPSNLHYTATWS